MTEPLVTHASFSIERTYPTSVQRVFTAFSDSAIRRRWFAEGEGWEVLEFTVDFRAGGRELSRFNFQGGAEIRNDTVYLDIVPEKRLVFAYSMSMHGKPFSASLTTIQFEAAPRATRLIYTEQAAFFEQADGAQRREEGCAELLDKLGEELRRSW